MNIALSRKGLQAFRTGLGLLLFNLTLELDLTHNPFALTNSYPLIRVDGCMRFSAAVRPLYRYIYFRLVPESKVYPEVALRDVIATASDLINLYLVASLDTETGTNGRPA